VGEDGQGDRQRGQPGTDKSEKRNNQIWPNFTGKTERKSGEPTTGARKSLLGTGNRRKRSPPKRTKAKGECPARIKHDASKNECRSQEKQQERGDFSKRIPGNLPRTNAGWPKHSLKSPKGTGNA